MKRLKLLLFVFLFVPGITSAQFLFKDVTPTTGIYMLSSGVGDVGPGVVIFDLDGDGWDDIYMPGGLDSDKLFLNMRDGTFKNIATPDFAVHGALPHPFRIYPRGGIAFDYDNDGYPDLYSACQNRDILWHNNGDGTFTDRTRNAHLNFPLDQNESNGATFGDFNGDGFNDFYVARWVNEYKFVQDGVGNQVGYAHKGFPDWFYVNNGDGTFTDRASDLSVGNDTGCGNIALFFDYDRDGDLDLLIGNDFGVELTPNQVYKNMLMETGTATFQRVDLQIGLQTHLFNMGIGPNDYDRDGNFDFYETSIGPEAFMRNNGDNTFKDVSKQILPLRNGFERGGVGYYATSWTALMADYDNDGWEDGFIVHGFEGGIPPWISNPSKLDTSIFLHNIDTVFRDYTDSALVDMNGKRAYLDIMARGAAYLDFNHDGKLDICLASLSINLFQTKSNYRLLQNITADRSNAGHWLEFRFTARRTAKEAIGTIVDVWAGGIRHSRQVSTGGGFGSQNSLMQHIGMGEFTKADSINVFWLCDKNRHRQIDHYENIEADHLYYVMENMASVPDTKLISLLPVIPPSAVAVNSRSNVPVFYPNPASNVLHVQNLQPDVQKHFEIYDLLGIKQIDVTGSESSFSLSVNSLRQGCYVLRITSEGNTITKQFIKD